MKFLGYLLDNNFSSETVHLLSKFVLLMGLVLGAISYTHAENFAYNGNEIYQLCRSKNDTDITRCGKYIIGVLDGRIAYMSGRAELGRNDQFTLGKASCAYSSGDATTQGLGLAVKWQVEDDHQRYDDVNGGIVVMDAVNRATRFRCGGSPYAQIDNAPRLNMLGKELFQICSSRALSDQLDCESYVIGVLDGRKAYMSEYADAIAVDSNPLPELCIYSDPSASLQRLRDAVVHEIQGDTLNYNLYTASIAVTAAIKVTFHCPQK